jgi:hypothetical protein
MNTVPVFVGVGSPPKVWIAYTTRAVSAPAGTGAVIENGA